MSAPHGRCRDTCTSARLFLRGPLRHPLGTNRSLYKGLPYPRQPGGRTCLPPLFTGHLNGIIEQLISAAVRSAFVRAQFLSPDSAGECPVAGADDLGHGPVVLGPNLLVDHDGWRPASSR